MTVSAVHMDVVTAALNALGVSDHDAVARVEITPHNVIITRYRRNEDGRRYIDDATGEPAIQADEMIIYWTGERTTA